MKLRMFFVPVLIFVFLNGSLAQTDSPAKWKFYAKRISRGIYELHLEATIDTPWHLYSQNNSKDGPIPTTITFNKSPLLTLESFTTENGKLISVHEDAFGMTVRYFEGKVDFVRKITVKSALKTNVSGYIHFMVCNSEKCLPAETKPFNIKLD